MLTVYGHIQTVSKCLDSLLHSPGFISLHFRKGWHPMFRTGRRAQLGVVLERMLNTSGLEIEILSTTIQSDSGCLIYGVMRGPSDVTFPIVNRTNSCFYDAIMEAFGYETDFNSWTFEVSVVMDSLHQSMTTPDTVSVVPSPLATDEVFRVESGSGDAADALIAGDGYNELTDNVTGTLTMGLNQNVVENDDNDNDALCEYTAQQQHIVEVELTAIDSVDPVLELIEQEQGTSNNSNGAAADWKESARPMVLQLIEQGLTPSIFDELREEMLLEVTSLSFIYSFFLQIIEMKHVHFFGFVTARGNSSGFGGRCK